MTTGYARRRIEGKVAPVIFAATHVFSSTGLSPSESIRCNADQRTLITLADFDVEWLGISLTDMTRVPSRVTKRSPGKSV